MPAEDAAALFTIERGCHTLCVIELLQSLQRRPDRHVHTLHAGSFTPPRKKNNVTHTRFAIPIVCRLCAACVPPNAETGNGQVNEPANRTNERRTTNVVLS